MDNVTEVLPSSLEQPQAVVSKPEPIVQTRLISKQALKKMVRSHGLQLGTDFYHALNTMATVKVLEAMKRMMEDGWRARLGIEDL